MEQIDGFARPLSYSVPFGQATFTWPNAVDVKVVMSSDQRDAGITVRVVGPGLALTCSTLGIPLPTDHRPRVDDRLPASKPRAGGRRDHAGDVRRAAGAERRHHDHGHSEEDIPELREVLVAMPEAGWDGWFSDWHNGGNGGKPAWETFHTVELPQLLERDWGAGADRVVAGLSQGGLGALGYAARHPGMYRAAASYSGNVDTTGYDFTSPLVWGT